MTKKYFLITFFFTVLIGCNQEVPSCDILIENGMIYNGSGEKPYKGSVAINNEKILYVGPKKQFISKKTINAEGKAISPGFINMLSWAYGSLLKDGRSLSDIKQGVTLEVFGEGNSPGPTGIKDSSDYISFGDAMLKLESKGVSTNIASFLGATTVRIQEVGYDNRKASLEEITNMKQLVQKSMEEGAMGIGSSLIYAPADYASTGELIALSKIAAEYGGMYISHIRNEDSKVLDAIDELITISKQADIPAEIYHLKASREANWNLLDKMIEKVEKARAEGLKITADMYTYNASSTGLTGVIPTWVQEGGHRAWINRMQESGPRKRVIEDIRKELLQQAPEGILMVGFNKEAMAEKYMGMTIAQVAKIRNQTPEETIVDLVIEDDSRIQCIYFSMSEDNIRKKIKLPWVSFCSDAGSFSDPSEKFRTHPRAFGSFIRVLGKYSRDEGLITLEEGIRKLTGFPAQNLGLKDRGFLKEKFYADVIVFDPKEVRDNATFDDPIQYAEGIEHVLVNGKQVLENGEHTGVFSGKFVKGPGYKDN
ncbi:MAG: amidohydrolase family protein [Flavobacteriaceae bacterium]|nr:amidohydrolase family protein [Flavobacteriaceae bacterium]